MNKYFVSYFWKDQQDQGYGNITYHIEETLITGKLVLELLKELRGEVAGEVAIFNIIKLADG